MQTRQLASTGVQVSPLCLGTMMFGAWGEPDHDESIRIIHAALDAGINFVDTADVYSRGESEEIVGKALAGGRRDDVFLATKVHGRMGDDPNQFGNSRRWIIAEVDNSLRRLGTDWIDLYQIHSPELDTDIDETLSALTDLVTAGKVRYIGSSTFPPSAVVEAQWVAEKRGRQRFITEQPPYSILVRGIEKRPPADDRERYGMGTLPWSPLAGGWLTGRYRKGQEVPESRRAAMVPQRYDMSIPANQAKLEAADALAELADEAGHHADRDGPRLPARAPRRSPRRSSARGRWSSWTASSPPPSQPRPGSSTGSTRSSRRERPSTRPTTAGRPRRSRTAPAAPRACRAFRRSPEGREVANVRPARRRLAQDSPRQPLEECARSVGIPLRHPSGAW